MFSLTLNWKMIILIIQNFYNDNQGYTVVRSVGLQKLRTDQELPHCTKLLQIKNPFLLSSYSVGSWCGLITKLKSTYDS